MDIQDIKKRYADAYIENFGDYEIVHTDKRELDWLIEEVEHLQFENETIRKNRTVQERKDFNRIKQLEEEVKVLKQLAKIKNDETTLRIQALETANDLLYMENQEYVKALDEIIEAEERLGIITVSDIAKKALGSDLHE